MDSQPSTTPDVLKAPETGHRVIRGSAIRVTGYGLGVLLTAVASVFLLRYLGVADFGRFVTVMSLISIITAISDAGLTAIGQREYVLRKTELDKRRLVANILGLRLILTPVAVIVAVAFAAIAGYPQVMVFGTALAGAGLVIFMAQGSLTLPLSAELRLVALSFTEVIRQLVLVISYMLLIVAGASFLPFFTVQIPAALIALIATILLVRKRAALKPMLDRAELKRLLIEALPMALSIAANVIYFRLLVIIMSLLVTAVETGYFATSFRIIELAVGVPFLLFSSVLPVLTRANDDGDMEKLKLILQRMIEVAFIMSCLLAGFIAVSADTIIQILGGSEYANAAPVLQMQAVALIAAFASQVWLLGLVSIHRQALLIASNVIALVSVFAFAFILIPAYEAEGGAITAIIGEVVLASATLFMLVRANSMLMPNFSFLFKIVAALLPAGLIVLLLRINSLAEAIVAASVYLLIIVLTKAIDLEILKLLFRRVPTSATAVDVGDK